MAWAQPHAWRHWARGIDVDRRLQGNTRLATRRRLRREMRGDRWPTRIERRRRPQRQSVTGPVDNHLATPQPLVDSVEEAIMWV